MTTLYPNAASPAHGVFVENRMTAFAAKTGAEMKVIAPVPWFPFGHSLFGKYAAFANAPRREQRAGFEVRHPRYGLPPKIGMTYAAHALERCFVEAALQLRREGWDFDLVDAHYFYPDGVAAVRAARRLGKPVVVTGRGTDISLIADYPRQRDMILQAVRKADHAVTVAAALKEKLVRLGAPAEKISVLRNGVDLEKFRPLDRDAIRRRMGLAGTVIASVGHLIERKGHDLVICAMAALPEATLLIVGDGPARGKLERLAVSEGLAARVRFLGAVDHDRLAEIYNAADILTLASSREGWPNVLLEAMACGTPAAASDVWGSGEVVSAPAAGVLFNDRTPGAIADAVKELCARNIDRAATRRFAERYSWDQTSERLETIFAQVVEKQKSAAAINATPIEIDPDKPQLMVTVDTEEIFDWSHFDAENFTIADVADIDRFQTLCGSLGVVPLYFLTYPLIKDPSTAQYFRALAEQGKADLGLHLHQWVTPPTTGFKGEYYSWQCNLPEETHTEKMRTLADAFVEAFGFRAVAHRAGRYGIAPHAYRALARAGVTMDFSPSPGFNLAGRGGPDFTGLSNKPFCLDVGAGHDPVFVTPVTGARIWKKFRRVEPREFGQIGFERRKAGPPSLLTTGVRLSCEGAGFAELTALTRRLIADGAPVLTYSLHSTTLTAGAGPYSRDAARVDEALARTERFLAFFRDEAGGEFTTLSGLRKAYGETAAPREKAVNLNSPLKARA